MIELFNFINLVRWILFIGFDVFINILFLILKFLLTFSIKSFFSIILKEIPLSVKILLIFIVLLRGLINWIINNRPLPRTWLLSSSLPYQVKTILSDLINFDKVFWIIVSIDCFFNIFVSWTSKWQLFISFFSLWVMNFFLVYLPSKNNERDRIVIEYSLLPEINRLILMSGFLRFNFFFDNNLNLFLIS